VFELQTRGRRINVNKPRNAKNGFKGTVLTRVALLPIKMDIQQTHVT